MFHDGTKGQKKKKKKSENFGGHPIPAKTRMKLSRWGMERNGKSKKEPNDHAYRKNRGRMQSR